MSKKCQHITINCKKLEDMVCGYTVCVRCGIHNKSYNDSSRTDYEVMNQYIEEQMSGAFDDALLVIDGLTEERGKELYSMTMQSLAEDATRGLIKSAMISYNK